MSKDDGRKTGELTKKRVLGDEWRDWDGELGSQNISEGKNTFLYLSMVVLFSIIMLAALFWYLIFPRFESFGRVWAILVSFLFIGTGVFVLTWYILLLIAVLSKKNYVNICLTKGSSLLFFILPLVLRFAASLGISRDRLSHSFIRVSNTLVKAETAGSGPVLALFPRCLKKDIRQQAISLCEEFPDVVFNTATGGSVARKIIRETAPRAIVAVACERDLLSGIQEIAPRIPVIGIPNNRPYGPCKDTIIEISELRSALDFFHKKR